MSTATVPSTLTVALIGNPNTGKSTLFSHLAGVRQRVGNYPGVTVEKKVGQVQFGQQRFELIDLPGTYSLAPRSLDEMVAVDVLLGRQADVGATQAVLCIVDASNIERNLYLVSQVLEMGLPTVVALNMIDIAEGRGIKIDVATLATRLGVPVIAVQANKGRGLLELKNALLTAAQSPVNVRENPFPQAFQQEVAQLERLLSTNQLPASTADGQTEQAARDAALRFLAERLLLDSGGYLETSELFRHLPELKTTLATARQRLKAAGLPVPAVEAMVRYDWVGRIVDGIVTKPRQREVTSSDRLDRVLTHKWLGTLIFALMMLLVFTSIFAIAKPPMDWIDGGIKALGKWTGQRLAEGPLKSLVVDGIFGGVGSVLVFLPQIVILFFFIAILEDCGYMARAAYLMDRLMSRVGLSGKSFIPLLSSFACAIPGIMATRVIENRRDRLTTILVAPLMSCAAKLSVYMLLIDTFIPATVLGGCLPLQGLVLFAMYGLGIIVAAAVAMLLKRTLLRGATPPFVMELPSYKWPSAALVLHRMVERGWAFIQRAGTVIFAVSVLVWAAGYYPHHSAEVEAPFALRKEALEIRQIELQRISPDDHEQLDTVAKELETLEKQIDGAYLQQSYLGRAGHFIEPAVKPLGWDWRIGAAAIASFPAREVVIGTLGVIYNLGDVKDETEPLKDKLRDATWDGTDRKVYNIPVALSIMVFFSLCAQCAGTLAVIRRETNSWRWPAFTFAYMTVLAYFAAMATYHLGMLFV